MTCDSCEAIPTHKKGEKVRIKSEWVEMNLKQLKSVVSFFAYDSKNIVRLAIIEFKEPFIHTFVVDNEEVDTLKEKHGWELIKTEPVFSVRSRRARPVIQNKYNAEDVMIKGSLKKK